MSRIKEVKGNLITLAKEGKFDVIAHGVNCFCTMGAGIAPQMAAEFGADTFPLEEPRYRRGDYNKLGQIDFRRVPLPAETSPHKAFLTVVNAYTQYGFGRNHKGGSEAPIDYLALRMVMQKINHIFAGQHIGLPWIGAGLAGGDWKRIRGIITNELTDCDVTLVEYDGS